MKKQLSLFILVTILLMAIKVDAQTIEKVSSTVVYLQRNIIETVNINSVNYEIYLKPVNGKLMPKMITRSGTGFLVSDGDFLFLVTAQHVAISMNSANSLVTFRTDNDRPVTFTLAQLAGSPVLNWVHHDKADVAVLPLKPSNEVLRYFKEDFLPEEMVLNKLQAPSREHPLTTIGFPLGLGVKDKFSPISRESKPASGLLNITRADTRRSEIFFLLDAPSIGGFSGAPIFEMPGGSLIENVMEIGSGLTCVGLIYGTVSDNTGGKLAAVVPGSFIVEAISKAKAVQKK